jgi:hypothetical protein
VALVTHETIRELFEIRQPDRPAEHVTPALRASKPVPARLDRTTIDCPPNDAGPLRAELYPFEVPMSALAEVGAQDWHQFAASVVTHRDQLVVSVRATGVRYDPTVNFIGTLSDDWRMQGAVPMRDLTPNPTYYYEDARLISRGERLQMSATALDSHALHVDMNRIRIAVLDVNDSGDFTGCHVQPSNRYEKNWMPLVTGDELRFVYAVEPVSTVLRYDDDKHLVVPGADKMPRVRGVLRGGSQLVPYEEGYLCVVHQVHSGLKYAQRFVRFDRFVQVRAVSRPFFFHSFDEPECCLGLAHWQGRMVLSYGVDKLQRAVLYAGLEKSSASVAIVTHETIRELFAR